MLNSNLTPFLFLAVSVGLFYSYLNPGYVHIQELRASQVQYQDALDRVQEIQGIRDDLVSRYNRIPGDDIDRLETLLPDSIDNVKLVLDLDGIASKHNIELQNVRINRPVQSMEVLDSGGQSTAKPYDELQVTFNFDATYEEFKAFLKEVEQSLRIIDVTNITVNQAGDEKSVEFTYNLSFKTYWLK